MPLHPIKPRNAAYTLLELSLVLGIFALLIAGVMAMVTQNTRRNAMMEVKRKMDVIEAELTDFRRLNGRLPCPADSARGITDQYFGIEAGYPTSIGTCTGNANPPPNAPFTNGVNTVGGDVPVKTLGLSDDYMFDPWGGRFFYAIDKRMTALSAFTTYNVASGIGSMSINDGSGNAKVTAGTVIAVFLSFGPDGHGAFQLGGLRKATGNTNASTQVNCHCDSNAAGTAWPGEPVPFIQAPATSTSPTDPTSFDDIVRYYTRSSFLSSSDTSTTR